MGEDRAELIAHDVGIVEIVGEGESFFHQRGNTCAVLLAGFNEVPEALWILVIVRQHVVCIIIMCYSTGLLGLLLKSLVSQPVFGAVLISWLV